MMTMRKLIKKMSPSSLRTSFWAWIDKEDEEAMLTYTATFNEVATNPWIKETDEEFEARMAVRRASRTPVGVTPTE